MKFLFLPSHCVPFHGRSLQERPLGGTETAVIRLAETLSDAGHEVIVVSDTQNPPLTQPLYIPSKALPFTTNVDIIIGVRDWRMALFPIKAKKRFFWTGDAYDQPITLGFGDKRIAASIDGFLAVSQWHAETTCKASGFPLEKSTVIRNGIDTGYFTEELPRETKRLIYSSTPYRGLALLPDIFKEIQTRHPDASLHIYSGYDVYKTPGDALLAQEREFEEIKAKFSSMSQVFFHGNLLQKDLAKEFLRSSILAYPNTFPETSCITAMESQAAGCVPVSSYLGGLPETVGDAGILIKERVGSTEYTKAFINSIDGLLGNPEKLQALSKLCRSKTESFSWKYVGERLLSLCS